LNYSKKRILKKWEKHAPHLYWGPRFDVRFYLVSEVLKHQGFNSILDVGCGPGIILSELKTSLKVGLDIQKESIEIAKKVDSQGLFLICDMNRLPFKNNIFDAIIAAGIIGIPNRKKRRALIQEIRRVMRNNGVLFLTTLNGQHKRYNNPNLISYFELRRLLKNFIYYIRGYNPLPTQKIFWRIPKFEKILFFFARLNLPKPKPLFFYVKAIKKES
jgi:ubiquinone/menaquinone biosynthesis C-methylase UbiE